MMKIPLLKIGYIIIFSLPLLFLLMSSVCFAIDITVDLSSTESSTTLLEVKVPEFPLSILEAVAPNLPLEIKGKASLNVVYDGVDVETVLTLASANIKARSYGLDLREVNGYIMYGSNILSFTLRGIWGDAKFNCVGTVEKNEEGFVVKKLLMESYGNRILVSGVVRKMPLSIKAHFTSLIKADRVATYLPELPARRLEQLQLAGDIVSEGDVIWEGGEIHAEGNVASQSFAIGEMQFEDISSPFTLEGTTLDFPQITAKFYRGDVSAKTKLRFGSFLFESEGEIQGIQLEKLLGGEGLNVAKDVKGVMKSNFYMSCNALDRQALAGGLSIKIKEGDLIELPLLFGVLRVLNLMKFGRLLVDEAEGDFTISDGKLKTQDFIFSSQSTLLKFSMNGDIDLWGKLNLTCTVRLPRKFHRRIPWIFNLPALIVSKTGEIVLPGVRITGTLKEPKHSIMPLFGGVGQSIKNLQR